MSGKLIVIEGLDGSGKATQTELLCKYLTEMNIGFTKLSYPNYNSPSSALVKMYLNGELADTPDKINPYAAAVFYAADRCADFIMYHKENYDNGGLFVSDRYATSNAVYQTGKLPVEQWSDYIHWLDDLEYGKLGIPKPDTVIYLDMSVEVSQKLLSSRYNGNESKKDIHECNVDFLRQCRTTALYCAEKLGWNVIKCDDGVNPFPVEMISQQIKTLTEDIIGSYTY